MKNKDDDPISKTSKVPELFSMSVPAQSEVSLEVVRGQMQAEIDSQENDIKRPIEALQEAPNPLMFLTSNDHIRGL